MGDKFADSTSDLNYSYPWTHPKSRAFKFFTLFIISLICFGSYFAYDEIQPFQTDLQAEPDYGLGIDSTKFGLLYSIYSFPNMVLPFFGGFFGDFFGLRLASIVLACFVVTGAFLVSMGPLLGSYWLMFAGRFLFGVGAESLNVTQTAMIPRWFGDSGELALSFGIVLAMSRLGDFLALVLGPSFATLLGDYKAALWIGTILAIVSFTAAIWYAVIDTYAEPFLKNDKTGDEKISMSTFKSLKDVRFWLVSVLCMSYYSGVLPFVAQLNDWLQQKYGVSTTTAAWYSGTVTMTSLFFSPLLGKAVDTLGRRPWFVVLGSLLIFPAHSMLAFTGPASQGFSIEVPPLIPIILVGFSFSLVPSALWPCVPMIIDGASVGTAFGVMTAVQNSGLSAANALAGYIKDNYGFNGQMVFFMIMDGVGLFLGIVLILVDLKKGGVLSRTSQQHKTKQLADTVN